MCITVETSKPNTALILKTIEENGESFKMALRLVTENDNPLFKNSVLHL